MKSVIRFVHAMPNAWFPAPGKNLVLKGVTAEWLSKACKSREIISHIRYEDHADRISAELGINLPSSGVNAPNPFNCTDMLVVASLSPGSSTVSYVVVYDATAIMEEAGIL